MNKSEYQQLTLGEIVTRNFKAAAIFTSKGVDFCCGGKKTLLEACNEKQLPPADIASQLLELENLPVGAGENFNEWSLDFLADYLVNTHHKYVVKTLPELVFYTDKIASVHGEHHGELLEIDTLFKEINAELTQHLKNEEEVLFPAIKQVLLSNSADAKEIIKSEIARMSGEHDFAGGAMDKINVMTQNYTVPADACDTYKVAFKMLHEFEDDLHIHVHLENNILFPKALALC